MKRTKQKSKKHLSLKIFWPIARAVALFSYFSYSVRQSKEYVREHLLVTNLKPDEGLSKKLKPPKG